MPFSQVEFFDLSSCLLMLHMFELVLFMLVIGITGEPTLAEAPTSACPAVSPATSIVCDLSNAPSVVVALASGLWGAQEAGA